MTPWLVPPAGPAEARRAAIAAQVPVRLTERLRLDVPRIEDFAVYRRIVADYDPSMSGEDTWLDFNQMTAGWLLRGYGLHAIRDRATGETLGLAPMGHEWGDPEPELGWFLTPEARGKGYAAEAGRAILDAYAELGIDPVAYVGVDNAPSGAVAARIGMERAESTRGCDVWRAPRLARNIPGEARSAGGSAPTLRTARLTLRPIRRDDFEPWAAFLASPRARFMEEGIDRDTAWDWLMHDAASWSLMGHGGLMIEAGGETVGEVSVLHPPRFPEREIGWLLYEGREGHGYATEAAAALRDHLTAAGVIDAPLVSYIDPRNAASIAVAERLGAVLDPNAEAPEPGTLVYRHPFGGAE